MSMDIHKEKPQDSNTIKHPSLWEGLVRLKSDSKYGQFLRFCVNGVLAVAIQYAVYWVLIKWIEVNIAYTLSYLVSFCCNFVITSYWTFHSSPSWKRLIGFGSSHIVNFFVQLGFL